LLHPMSQNRTKPICPDREVYTEHQLQHTHYIQDDTA
jgi:hypothetical protein